MAECLAGRLQYPLLGQEILQDAADRLGVSERLLEQKMSEPPPLWDRFLSVRRTYLIATQAALAERAVEGNLVYHGLTGGFLLPSTPATFRVRLIVPLDRRIRAVMQESGMDAAAAEAYIRDVDDARVRWVKVMHGADIMDPSLYDLVVNLRTMTVGDACAVAARAASQPEFAVTDSVKARLEDFRVACQVKLALVSDPEVGALDLDAEVERGTVVVTGEAPLLKTGWVGNRIVELAGAVPGVKEVRLKIEWFDPYW